jgi:hypothetical protein
LFVCFFLLYWAGLQIGDEKEKLMDGARKLMKLVADVAKDKVDGDDRPAVVASVD